MCLKCHGRGGGRKVDWGNNLEWVMACMKSFRHICSSCTYSLPKTTAPFNTTNIKIIYAYACICMSGAKPHMSPIQIYFFSVALLLECPDFHHLFCSLGCSYFLHFYPAQPD